MEYQYPGSTVLDCSKPLLEFSSQISMLSNQEYPSEELLEHLVSAALAPNSQMMLNEVIDHFANHHEHDNETLQARRHIQALANAVTAALRSVFPVTEEVAGLPYFVVGINFGLVNLKRRF